MWLKFLSTKNNVENTDAEEEHKVETQKVEAQKDSPNPTTATTKKVASGKSQATTIMKAMSNPQRLQILAHLLDGELSVSDLESNIKTLSQSALSQHLGRLRRANILKTRRHSQMIYYSIRDENVREIMQLLNKIYTNDSVFQARSR